MKRPEIKRTPYHIIMNTLSILVLVGTYLFLALSWKQIPSQIPGHYNGSGEINRWASKAELWILPSIGVFLYAMISLFEHFPQTWNTGIAVTEENREDVYRILKNMVVTLKLILVLTFSFLTVWSSLSLPLPVWFLPLFLVLLFGTLTIFIVALLKKR